MKGNIFGFGTAACLLLAFPRAEAAPQVGKPAPDLGLEQVLQAPAGTEATWEKLKGKVVVLEFWATWCAPCIAAIPHLNELAEHFKGKPVQFIAITDEENKVIEAFLKKRAMRAWIGLDTDKSMFKAYSISSIPHTVVVNTNGIIEAITYPMSLKPEHIENLLLGKRAGFAARPADEPRVAANSPPADGKPPVFQVTLRPSEETASRMNSGPAGKTEFGTVFEYKMYGSTLTESLPAVFGVSSARLIVNATMPTGHFDFLVRLPQKQSDRMKSLMQDALRTSFGLISRREERETEVYLLKVKEPGHKGLQETASTGGMSASSGPGQATAVNGKMSGLARSLESLLKRPVLDQTGLKGGFDYEVKWKQNQGADADAEVVISALREQLGLDLERSRQSIEFVIVEAEQTVAEKN